MWIIIKKLVASSFLFVSISCNNATINEVEQVPLINSKFSNAIHVDKDQANMVNYNFDSKVTTYEKFNELIYTKKVKEIIDTKSSFADWLNNQNVRNDLKLGIKICLVKNGYPPQYSPEVFTKVMEQVENFEENSNDKL